MKRIMLLFLILVSCKNDFNNKDTTNNPHINLRLMVVPTTQTRYASGYAVYGEITNNTGKDIGFKMPAMYIEKLAANGTWEELWRISPYGTYVTSKSQNDTSTNVISKSFPYEWEEISSFGKIDTNYHISKLVLKMLKSPPNNYNINKLGSYALYHCFIKKDSTISFSRSVDDLINIQNNFFKAVIKKGEYRAFYRRRKELKLDSIKLINASNHKVNILFPSRFGSFEIIDNELVNSDTLYFKVY